MFRITTRYCHVIHKRPCCQNECKNQSWDTITASDMINWNQMFSWFKTIIVISPSLIKQCNALGNIYNYQHILQIQSITNVSVLVIIFKFTIDDIFESVIIRIVLPIKSKQRQTLQKVVRLTANSSSTVNDLYDYVLTNHCWKHQLSFASIISPSNRIFYSTSRASIRITKVLHFFNSKV